jgi:hypothetical protein
MVPSVIVGKETGTRLESRQPASIRKPKNGLRAANEPGLEYHGGSVGIASFRPLFNFHSGTEIACENL